MITRHLPIYLDYHKMLKYINSHLEIKAVGDEGEFEGHASVFGNIDEGNDIVVPGAFKETLKEHKANGTSPAILWQHDPRQPIGTPVDLKEDDKGLRVKGQLVLDVQQAREAHALLKSGAVSGMSIGFMPKKQETDEETGIRKLISVDLWEFSIVTFPMNPRAQVDAVKGRLFGGEMLDERELELVLRDAGLSKRQAKGLIATGFKGYSRRDADDTDELLQAVANVIPTR